MELAKQVASLESSKRLKELGAVQESLFYWQHPWKDYCGNPPADLGFQVDKFILVDSSHMSFRAGPFSAFTCAELGEMLPYKIFKESWAYHLVMSKNNLQYSVAYQSFAAKDKHDSVKTEHVHWAEIEADTRARMLIYLIENKLAGKESHEH